MKLFHWLKYKFHPFFTTSSQSSLKLRRGTPEAPIFLFLEKCKEMLVTTLSAFDEKERCNMHRIGDMVEADARSSDDNVIISSCHHHESTSKAKLAECLKTIGCISGNENVFS